VLSGKLLLKLDDKADLVNTLIFFKINMLLKY
jgi:hypothetical protein